MPEALTISIQFANEGVECNACVEPLGDGLYRVLDSLALVEGADYGDTVELRSTGDNHFQFVRLVESANFRIFHWVLDSTTVASDALREVFDRVESHNGYWENYFGGCVYIALPPDDEYDPWADLNSTPELETAVADPIQQCREEFGSPPRQLSMRERLGYLWVQRPSWLLLNPRDRLATLFRRIEKIYRDGTIVWGHVVQVNELMFEAGNDNCPGDVVYSLRDADKVNPQLLRNVADRLYSLKGTEPDDAAIASIAEHLTNEMTRAFGIEVPSTISPHVGCRVSTTFFVRKHLPNRRLCSPVIPILVHPEQPQVVMPLPARYWPQEFIEWWVDSENQTGLIDSQPGSEAVENVARGCDLPIARCSRCDVAVEAVTLRRVPTVLVVLGFPIVLFALLQSFTLRHEMGDRYCPNCYRRQVFCYCVVAIWSLGLLAYICFRLVSGRGL